MMIDNSALQLEKDKVFMLEALDEAEQAALAGDWPIGCVIVVDGKIIGRGRNRAYSRKDRTSHAEMEALKNASVLLLAKGREATLYVTYEPCPMCFGGCLLNHIGRIVCGPDLDGSGSVNNSSNLPLRFKEDKYKVEIVTNFMIEECIAAINKSPFFAERLMSKHKGVKKNNILDYLNRNNLYYNKLKEWISVEKGNK
jgi:tRNA(adenine34) deaminase